MAETTTSPQSAIAEYRLLLKLKPGDINSTYNLGLLLYDSGKVAQGRVLLKRAIALDPALGFAAATTICCRRINFFPRRAAVRVEPCYSGAGKLMNTHNLKAWQLRRQ